MSSSQVSESDVGAETEDRTFTILSINDVYRMEGFVEADEAGLARVRALRAELEKEHDVLFLHGGDFLFPSLLSRVFDGAQMVFALNLMDGSAEFDDQMAVVVGNHEFDKGDWDDWPLFQARLDESQFLWLTANIDFGTKDGLGVKSDRMRDNKIFDVGGVRVGVYGLTMNSPVEFATISGSRDELLAESRRQIADLRSKDAEVIVALTHLGAAMDSLLLQQELTPDLLIGGHDHSRIEAKVNGTYLLKAASDGREAWATTVTVKDGGALAIEPVIHEVSHSPADPQLASAAKMSVRLHEELYCGDNDLPPGCLTEVFAVAGQHIVGEEVAIRSASSNLGNYVADQMAAAVRQTNPDEYEDVVAIINSGSLRLNRDISEGELITRRAIAELLQYSSGLYYKELRGDTLAAALNHSVACRGGGPWLQVSKGLQFTADISANRASDIVVSGEPLDREKHYGVVTNAFLAGQVMDAPDGYDLGRGWVEVFESLSDAVCAGLGGCQPTTPRPTLTLDGTHRARLPAGVGDATATSAACGVE